MLGHTLSSPGDGGAGDDRCRSDDGLTLAEMQAQSSMALPDREALSTIPSDPTTALLDVFVDLDAALDLAAPINAALAANANAALPIDAAVSANALSPGSVSLGEASQTSIVEQVLQADATASSNQDSAIMQGEGGGAAGTDAGGQTGETELAPPADTDAGEAHETGEQLVPVADAGEVQAPAEQVAPVDGAAIGQEPAEQVAPVDDAAVAAEPVAQTAPVTDDAIADTAPVPEPSPTVDPSAVLEAGDNSAPAQSAAGAMSDYAKGA